VENRTLRTVSVLGCYSTGTTDRFGNIQVFRLVYAALSLAVPNILEELGRNEIPCCRGLRRPGPGPGITDNVPVQAGFGPD
jgi:hypothetical protein